MHKRSLNLIISTVLFNFKLLCLVYECGDDISQISNEETVVVINHQSPTDIGTMMRIFQVRFASCRSQ